MQDVAREANVSVGTVSNVMNEQRNVAPDTRMRVLEAADKLGYSVNSLARGLRRHTTMSLGLLLPTLLNPFYPSVVRGVEDEAHTCGYSVFICSTDRQEERERSLVRSMLEKRVDGLITVSPSRPLDELFHNSEEIPVVVVEGGRLGHAIRDSVTLDAARAIADAAAYLQIQGHRRLGFVKGPTGIPRAEERWVLWQQAAGSCGMNWVDEAVFTGDFSFESGVDACKRLLHIPSPPTAVITANDLMALGILKTYWQAGRRIPDELSLIGYDDIPAGDYVTPPLTTIAVPTYQQGRTAVQMLLRRVAEPLIPRQVAVLEASYMNRGSTGPVPQHVGS